MNNKQTDQKSRGLNENSAIKGQLNQIHDINNALSVYRPFYFLPFVS